MRRPASGLAALALLALSACSDGSGPGGAADGSFSYVLEGRTYAPRTVVAYRETTPDIPDGPAGGPSIVVTAYGANGNYIAGLSVSPSVGVHDVHTDPMFQAGFGTSDDPFANGYSHWEARRDIAGADGTITITSLGERVTGTFEVTVVNQMAQEPSPTTVVTGSFDVALEDR